jgi:hypothetical protein
MSSIVTVGTGSATIYGSLAGAVSYFDMSGSDASVAFRALAATSDEQKRKLVDATRFLNRIGWATGYTTFALRDALDLGTGDGDAAFPFRAASYELAAAAVVDPDVLNVDDQGTNIQSVGAGGAQVTFFSPTSAARGTASLLPRSVMDLIGPYLADAGTGLAGAGTGDSGSCENPFGPDADYDKRGVW